jgi:phage terminase large subunit-like protein
LDPGRLVVMFTSDPDADWTDEATWADPNPALDDFLDRRVLRDECRKAVANPAAERSFRQYRLNQPVGAIGRAINMHVWDTTAGLVGHREVEEIMEGRVCYGGLDLASTSDLAAYALDFPDGQGAHDVIWRGFAPSSAIRDLDRRTGGQASVWAATGVLTVTDGNVIDYGAIKLAMIADRDRFEIREIAFDRWGATQLSSELLDEGFPLVQFGQGFASMSPPTKELLRLVAAGAYRHGGNPLTRWQASNLVTRSDPAGNLKPDKARSVDKIDGMVAGIMALDRASQRTAQDTEPVYATAGFR